MGKNNNNLQKKHADECMCEICSNNIREERQFGALMVKEGVLKILDAEEIAHFNKYLDERDQGRKEQPTFVRVEPDDNKLPVLAYGVLIPQYGFDMDSWSKELDKYKNFAFGTLEEQQILLSAYRDFKLFEDNKIYVTHIPCALLLDTCLDLSVQKEYGFGYTSFLLYKGFEIFDNILNRDFMFCLGGMETKFNTYDLEHWKDYIDVDEVMNVAKRLF